MQSAAPHTRLIASLLQILFPSSCPACSASTDTLAEAPFCRTCWTSLKLREGPSCSVCAEPLASPHADTCAHCLASPPPFSKINVFGLYDGVLSAAIHEYKFKGVRRLKRPLTQLLLNVQAGPADAVVAVPSGPSALRHRGFNQSLLLAYGIARSRGIPLLTGCLRKKTDTAPQVGLPAELRAKNLRGMFEAGRSCEGLRILLVDDVVTTGATVRECSAVLRQAGARDVVVLALARAGSP